MTALERIKEIEAALPLAKAANGMPAQFKYDIAPESIEFLLHAFQLMREIAISHYDPTHSICSDADECRCEGIADKEIDKEFEERMSK